jgi:hypothetical protein
MQHFNGILFTQTLGTGHRGNSNLADLWFSKLIVVGQSQVTDGASIQS